MPTADSLEHNKKLSLVSSFLCGDTSLGRLFVASLEANLSIEILADSALIYGSAKDCRRHGFFPEGDAEQKKQVLQYLLIETLWEIYREG